MPSGYTENAQHKACLTCGEPLPITRNPRMTRHTSCRVKHWNEKRKENQSYKEKRTVESKKRWERMPESEKAIQRKWQAELRQKQKKMVMEHYGGCCACCGETRIEFLAIDHIHGDGNKHRAEMGSGGRIYRWLIQNNYPTDRFRVLCHNCNFSLGHYGYCPHNVANADQNAAINIAARANVN